MLIYLNHTRSVSRDVRKIQQQLIFGTNHNFYVAITVKEFPTVQTEIILIKLAQKNDHRFIVCGLKNIYYMKN